MSGGSRKAHSKSRRGCGQCKRRRVRCDLRPPVCSNCERRGEDCDYLSLQLGYTLPTAAAEPANGPSQEPNLKVRDLADDDIELHFKTVTSKTLGFMPISPEHDPWQHAVPERMRSNGWLRHGALSISALHLSHLQPDLAELYYHCACQHQDQAMPLFRESVGSIDTSNVLDVVGFCVIITTFNFFVAKRAASINPDSDVEVFEPFLALRSGALLVHDCLPTVQKTDGPLKGIMGSLWSVPPPPVDHETHQAINGLDQVISFSQTAEHSASLCSDAAIVLKQNFLRFSFRPKGWLHIVFWPTAITQEFVDLLRASNQAVMVVFTYWCASLNTAPKMWWLEGWAEAAGNAYLERIDSRWQYLLAWPRSQLSPRKSLGLAGSDESAHFGSTGGL